MKLSTCNVFLIKIFDNHIMKVRLPSHHDRNIWNVMKYWLFMGNFMLSPKELVTLVCLRPFPKYAWFMLTMSQFRDYKLHQEKGNFSPKNVPLKNYVPGTCVIGFYSSFAVFEILGSIPSIRESISNLEFYDLFYVTVKKLLCRSVFIFS